MKNNSFSLFVRRPTWGGRIYAFRLFCLAAVFVFLSSAMGLGQDDPSAAITGSGTTDFIPIWTNGTTLGNSVFFQLGTGAKAKVGIGTTKPASTLDVKGGGTIRGLFSLPTTGTATTNTGFNSQPMDLAASAFNSSTSTPVTQTFQWQAEPVGNNTSSASGSLNLLFAEGSGKFAETGFQIDSNGQITFATGQSGSGLGNVDASELGGLAASAFAQLAAANTFTANQTVNGNVSAAQLVSTVGQGTAPLQVTSTTQVPNLNASLLGGSSASAFQPAGSYAVLNTNMVFGYQTVATNGGQATLMTIPNLGAVLVDCDSSLSRIAFFPAAGVTGSLWFINGGATGFASGNGGTQLSNQATDDLITAQFATTTQNATMVISGHPASTCIYAGQAIVQGPGLHDRAQAHRGRPSR
ncbi:MAG TPA: hypothetical protein VN777_13050 [Terriglobales bacterium]|nr:hypothetical protein [Terriglobales bacterium]